MTSEREAYVYVQFPGTLSTVPAALLNRPGPTARRLGAFAMAIVISSVPKRLHLTRTACRWIKPSMSSLNSRVSLVLCVMRAQTLGDGGSSSTSSNVLRVIYMKSTICCMARRMGLAI